MTTKLPDVWVSRHGGEPVALLAELDEARARIAELEAELAAERKRRGSAEWALKEIRLHLHAAGRRPEECWEMSEIDGHLAQFERHKD